MSRPSGDHRGTPVPVGARSDVSWTALEPSGSETQISQAPERVDVNATRRPSGENMQWISALVDEIAIVGGASGATASIRQMFSSLKLRTYTSRGGLSGCAREIA